MTATAAAAAGTRRSAWRRRVELVRLFLHEQQDPGPFYRRLAADAVAQLPVPVDGRRVLDLGCGPGFYSDALAAAGAAVVPIDSSLDELHLAGAAPPGASVADARCIPVRSGSIDVAMCSNMLEHTPAPGAVLDELGRVLAVGGVLWLSWTNWYSPWGGHELSPLHYLGAGTATRLHRRFRRRPLKNVPGESLFPTHIGRVLRLVQAAGTWDLLDAHPRYYPSQRWLMKVPGVREVASWNCVLVLRRTG